MPLALITEHPLTYEARENTELRYAIIECINVFSYRKALKEVYLNFGNETYRIPRSAINIIVTNFIERGIKSDDSGEQELDTKSCDNCSINKQVRNLNYECLNKEASPECWLDKDGLTDWQIAALLFRGILTKLLFLFESRLLNRI